MTQGKSNGLEALLTRKQRGGIRELDLDIVLTKDLVTDIGGADFEAGTRGKLKKVQKNEYTLDLDWEVTCKLTPKEGANKSELKYGPYYKGETTPGAHGYKVTPGKSAYLGEVKRILKGGKVEWLYKNTIRGIIVSDSRCFKLTQKRKENPGGTE